MSKIEFKPTGNKVGCFIYTDLKEVKKGQIVEIKKLLDNYGVLFFKNQDLNPEQYINFSSNFAAFIIFAIQGYVIWLLGLIMAVAQIAGAYTGSRFAIKNGEKVVRPVLVIVSLLLSARILFG